MKFLALLVLSLASDVFAQPTASDVLILDRTLSQGYDWRIRPRPVDSRGAPIDKPTNITANLYIRRVKLVDDLLDAEVTLRQTWNDYRLGYSREFPDSPAYVHIHPLEKAERRIWAPDTFFQNAFDVEIQNLPSPNEMQRIHNNGDVLSSQKFSLKVPCGTAFDKYPHDLLKCNIDFASYAYTVADIVYQWRNDAPVQLREGLGQSLGEFTLDNIATEQQSSKAALGEYSGLRVSLNFKRTPASLSSKLYIIPLLLALLSLLPMIINAQSIVVRVIIGFFCLSTLILHWSIIGNGLPKSGGASTGAEVWITRCLAFIAATLVQLVFFVWITRTTTSYKERKLAKLRAAKERLVLARDGTLEDNVVLISDPTLPERKMSVGLLVDMISLGIFIIAFLVFMLHYFSKY